MHQGRHTGMTVMMTVIAFHLPSLASSICKVAKYRLEYCAEPKEPTNLVVYLVRRYKICHFPLVVTYLCIRQNHKNQPNLVLYLVRRSKIFVSVATLSICRGSRNLLFECRPFDKRNNEHNQVAPPIYLVPPPSSLGRRRSAQRQ